MRTVYVLAGDYSGPEDARRVFTPAGHEEAGPQLLLRLIREASARALRSVRLDDIRHHITHLSCTTMPDPDGRVMAGAIHIPTHLKRDLSLPDHCQARLEVGTSDAGATLFASAVHKLRGVAHPATALVVGGQVLGGGSRAVETVALSLEEAERRLGVNMLTIGDLLSDLHGHWLGQEVTGRAWDRGAKAPGHPSSPAPPSGEAWCSYICELRKELVMFRMQLAGEYPAAQRRIHPDAQPADPDSRQAQEQAYQRSPLLGRWLRRWHVAPASNGACAVLLTTDEQLVRAWLAADSSRKRVVRVLGIGEGDAHPSLAARREPFGYAKALRQALVELRRQAGVNHDYLRASAFAVLHDAFPAIEFAFLLGLGFTPLEALHRAFSYWPNPYGGLTTFGHALAASGLVQIAKAFHILMRDPRYLHPQVRSQHVDWGSTSMPLSCLTTSVGGPLSHVVATILQACTLPAKQQADQPLLTEFVPKTRYRQDEAIHNYRDFEAKTRWVGDMAERYRQAYRQHRASAVGEDRFCAVVEARSEIDIRHAPRPLPEELLAAWSPCPARWSAMGLPASQREAMREPLRQVLHARDPQEARDQIGAVIQRLSAAGEGTAGLSKRDVEQSLWAVLRLPVVQVAGDLPPTEDGGDEQRHHGFALLHPQAAGPEEDLIGRLVALRKGPAQPLVMRVLGKGEFPGLVPPWYAGAGDGPPLVLLRARLSAPAHAPAHARGSRSDQSMGTELDLANLETTRVDAGELLGALARDGLTPKMLRPIYRVAEAALEEVLSQPNEVPPAAFGRLFHELVLRPDISRARLRSALQELLGEPDHPHVKTELVEYCEFNLLETRDIDDAALSLRLGVLMDALRRAEAWLGGSVINHERVGDSFSVTIRGRVGSAEPSANLVRFLRDVYLYCAEAGVAVRGAAAVGNGIVFQEVHRGQHGVVGSVSRAVHLVVREAGPFKKQAKMEDRPPGRRDGIAVVLYGDSWRGQAAQRFREIWEEAGGERMERLPMAQIPGAGRDEEIYYQVARAHEVRGGMAARL